MFPNLRAEMARCGIDGVKIAKHLACSPKTFSSKLTGKTEFTRAELFMIQKEFFPQCSIDYLFDQNAKQNTA